MYNTDWLPLVARLVEAQRFCNYLFPKQTAAPQPGRPPGCPGPGAGAWGSRHVSGSVAPGFASAWHTYQRSGCGYGPPVLGGRHCGGRPRLRRASELARFVRTTSIHSLVLRSHRLPTAGRPPIEAPPVQPLFPLALVLVPLLMLLLLLLQL
jgi:hypothetical protein